MKWFLPGAVCCVCVLALDAAMGRQPAVAAPLVLSGNENKIDLADGGQRVVADAPPDSISLLDFAVFPPRVEHLRGVSNSVIGPPSNIAVSPQGRVALVASSLKVDSNNPDRWIPDDRIHILDLRRHPPEVVGHVRVGAQPSGMSFTPDGRYALVANRAEGSVALLRVEGLRVEPVQTVRVCPADQSASDVAVHPDGRRVLVSVNRGGYLRLLEIEDGKLLMHERKISTYGQPYRTLFTPDGQLGLTAGPGQGGAPDVDALTIVDMTADPVHTIDFVALGAGPESIEISPDGRLLAAVVMNGSSLAPTDPLFRPHGLLVLLRRDGKRFQRVQQVPIGRIPEGVAFTADGRYLLVQCHPERQIWIFRIEGDRAVDTGHRVTTPGMPSSIRAVPLP